ncbi:NUDIX hydrolase [Halonatronum saccharophilum]|uniref:NUDIX hydrolase n=1 Tax=Halonatronum saccharophilum TaxID=150060 RepID=UPI00047F966D|nr:CoA pyrophosphatase [Halonatronum saccharophilum]
MRVKDLKKLKDSLLKQPNIHQRDEYFNSAVLIPLINLKGEYYLLFQLRAESIRQGGEISFPGGRYEKEVDVDYQAAAIRECVEELGIAREKIEVIGRLDTMVTPMGIIIEPFIGFLHISSLDQFDINKDEVERVFALPLSYFIENKPKEYGIKVEFQPYYFDEDGKKEILLPAEELGLQERYKEPWSGKDRSVYLYSTSEGTIWGITAALIQ